MPVLLETEFEVRTRLWQYIPAEKAQFACEVPLGSTMIWKARSRAKAVMMAAM